MILSSKYWNMLEIKFSKTNFIVKIYSLKRIQQSNFCLKIPFLKLSFRIILKFYKKFLGIFVNNKFWDPQSEFSLTLQLLEIWTFFQPNPKNSFDPFTLASSLTFSPPLLLPCTTIIKAADHQPPVTLLHRRRRRLWPSHQPPSSLSPSFGKSSPLHSIMLLSFKSVNFSATDLQLLLFSDDWWCICSSRSCFDWWKPTSIVLGGFPLFFFYFAPFSAITEACPKKNTNFFMVSWFLGWNEFFDDSILCSVPLEAI